MPQLMQSKLNAPRILQVRSFIPSDNLYLYRHRPASQQVFVICLRLSRLALVMMMTTCQHARI